MGVFKKFFAPSPFVQLHEHAQKVWSAFNMSSLGHYHDLYLVADVLQLCSVFEDFRAFSLQTYKLDPAQFLTIPSLAFSSCLKYTDVRLQLLHDEDMYLFCEAGIRGGVAMVSQRYAHANNPLMTDYDASKETSYLVYLDAK